MSELELIGTQQLEIEKLKKENKSLSEKLKSSRNSAELARDDAITVCRQIEDMIPESIHYGGSLSVRIGLMVGEIQRSRLLQATKANHAEN